MIESATENIKNLLIDSSFKIPVAYAAWRSGGNEVFVSNKLKLMLSADSNFIDSYAFVKLMKSLFGSFLNVASAKISENGRDNKYEYSSAITILNETFVLKLAFEKTKQFYMFIAETPRKTETSKETDNEKSCSELKKILDSFPIYVWQKDKNLRITYCNKAYAYAVETTPDAVVANNIKLIPSSSSSRRNSTYVDQTLYSSKPKKTKERVVINGSRKCLQIIETPFIKNDFSTSVAIDITDKEELKKEYDNYKKQTEETLDNISIPIAIFNKETNLIFANSAMTKLFPLDGIDLENYTFANLIDRLIDNGSIIVVSDIAEYKETVNRLFSTIIEPYHASVTLKNDITMNVTISPNIDGGLIFMFEDISEKLVLEREINSTSATQAETFNNLSEGIIIFGADNKIKIANPLIDDILGKNSNKIVGKHIRDFFKAISKSFNLSGDTENWVPNLIDMLMQRVKFSGSATLSSGKTFKYNYAPLPAGLNLITFLETTDSVELGKTRAEKNEIVSQFNKLKANLISNISGELKSPLNTISGFVEILHKQYFGNLNDKQLEYCLGIKKTAERAIEIVDAVINLANIKAGLISLKYEEINLLDFINECIEPFANQANEQKIDIKTDFADSAFKAFFDRRAMKKVLSQLISRAIRVSSNGGNVVIGVKLPKSNDGYFELIAQDAGASFPEEDLEKIQKILSNDIDDEINDRLLELGIVLANSIVKLHHGKMLINSKNGEGNTIKCIIPIKQFLL